MAGRESASFSSMRIFLLGRRGAFRRAIAASLRRRAALLATTQRRRGPLSTSSWQGILVCPGGAPAPPGSLGGAFVSRPRAPHPCSTIKTPHDSALVEQDGEDYAPIRNAVKTKIGIFYPRWTSAEYPPARDIP